MSYIHVKHLNHLYIYLYWYPEVFGTGSLDHLSPELFFMIENVEHFCTQTVTIKDAWQPVHTHEIHKLEVGEEAKTRKMTGQNTTSWEKQKTPYEGTSLHLTRQYWNGLQQQIILVFTVKMLHSPMFWLKKKIFSICSNSLNYFLLSPRLQFAMPPSK